MKPLCEWFRIVCNMKVDNGPSYRHPSRHDRRGNSRCRRRRTTKRSALPPQTKRGELSFGNKTLRDEMAAEDATLLAWLCSSSTTANYEGHYTVEVASNSRTAQGFLFPRCTGATGSGITHFRKNFSHEWLRSLPKLHDHWSYVKNCSSPMYYHHQRRPKQRLPAQ